MAYKIKSTSGMSAKEMSDYAKELMDKDKKSSSTNLDAMYKSDMQKDAKEGKLGVIDRLAKNETAVKVATGISDAADWIYNKITRKRKKRNLSWDNVVVNAKRTLRDN